MNSRFFDVAMPSLSGLALALTCAGGAACIVDQNLGDRTDGATGADAMNPSDARPSDGSVTVEDVAPRTDATVPTDVQSPAVDASQDSSAPPSDGAVVNIRSIEITASTTRPAMLMSPATTSVEVVFRDRPRTDATPTVLERAGDCLFQESRALPNAAPPTLDGVTVRVIAPGMGPLVARRDALSTSDFVAARYTAGFASALAAGTIVRVEVDAFGSVPAFSREVAVADVRYQAPTPVNEASSWRTLTRSAGQPMPIGFSFSGPMLDDSLFDLVLISSEGVVRELRCDLPRGSTMTTIAASLLDRAARYGTTALGQPSALVQGNHRVSSSTLSNGTTVTISSGATMHAIMRF